MITGLLVHFWAGCFFFRSVGGEKEPSYKLKAIKFSLLDKNSQTSLNERINGENFEKNPFIWWKFEEAAFDSTVNYDIYAIEKLRIYLSKMNPSLKKYVIKKSLSHFRKEYMKGRTENTKIGSYRVKITSFFSFARLLFPISSPFFWKFLVDTQFLVYDICLLILFLFKLFSIFKASV